MPDIPPPATPTFSHAYTLSPLLTDPLWDAIPVPLTSLIGRDREIDHICELVTVEGTRLITLTGPGGIGKTRLAIEVATQLAPKFAHGACFVALSSVRDAGSVAGIVAAALGLREDGEAPAEETLVSNLRDRHLLLVLDNLEHVVRGTDLWLAALFADCPLIKVLATSRIAVQIDGEQRYIVPPLPLPTGGTNEKVTDNAAVRLFAQRARAVNPDFILSPDYAGAISEICCQLEGLPLAIELAASRVNMLSPPAILARMSRCLSLLNCKRQDAPDRQRTMRDAIAWSYELLPQEEQGLFRRLAVFAGGFSLEAAEAVGGPMSLEMLSVLVDHSLVRCLPDQNDTIRMAMYETIREYGLQELIAREDEVAARDAHAAYFLQMAAEWNWDKRIFPRLERCAPFEVEQGNLKAAIGWLVQRERFEEATTLTIDTCWCLWLPRLDTDSRDVLERLFAHIQAAIHSRRGASVPDDFRGLVRMLREPSRERFAAEEVISTYAGRLAVGQFAPVNRGKHAGVGNHPSLEGDDPDGDAFDTASSDALADPPGQSVMANAPMGLTPRELEVLRLMADGLTNQEIADSLFLSLRTITSHVSRVLIKLAVPSRTAAVSHAIRRGII